MASRIYLIDQDETLRALPERPYDSEDLLQELLGKYPDLLAGDQMGAGSPRRWLLVSREYGVPGEEGGSNRWALDHLFLDQDGVPTLVEVKRSSDTRIRREVVGQMLDYAANAVRYWPVAQIREAFEGAAESQGEDPTRLVLQLLDSEQEELDSEQEERVEAFWKSVETNLQTGRVRMVFVADRIPLELQRIVEFLNEQMARAEVLAVEVKQFLGGGVRTLVPKVIGQTASAVQKKQAGASVAAVWTEERFLREMAQRHGYPAAEAATEILRWAEGRGLRIWWGRGMQEGSFFPVLDRGREGHSFAAFWTYGSVELQFQHMRGRFADEAARMDLLRRLNAILGVDLDPTRIGARPSFHINVLAAAEHRARFLEVWETYLTRIENTAAPQGTPDSSSPHAT